MVQPAWQPDYRTSEAPRPTRGKPRDPAAGFERRAVPLTARELLPMVAILLLVSTVAAVTIVYLTAFGRLTVQGAREQQLDRQIGQYQQFNRGLAGDVARLERTDRLEREARRLGLEPFDAARTDTVARPARLLDEPVAALTVGQLPPVERGP